MDINILKSFVKTAAALQSDQSTPPDYYMAKVAFLGSLRRVPGAVFGHGAANELTGLGVLAVPSAMRLAGHPVSKEHEDMAEVGGLGILAAPYARQMLSARRAGRALGHI